MVEIGKLGLFGLASKDDGICNWVGVRILSIYLQFKMSMIFLYNITKVMIYRSS